MIGSTNIEHAIYTSARTALGEGYHLVARSPGISDAEARELSAWSPSHDGLLPDIPEQRSVNFFTLESGLACVSRSAIHGEDYSQRGAPRLVTNLLLVADDVLKRFSNDPFAVLKAVELSGRLTLGELAPTAHLAPLALVGRAQAVNEKLLGETLAAIGPARLGLAIESLLAGRPVALGGPLSTEKLFASVWQCLPVECRTAFSFTTGLQFTPRRPFDLAAWPADPASRRRLAQRHNVRGVDLNEPQDWRLTPGGWANHVALTLACGGVRQLSAQLAVERPGLTLADLPSLAESLSAAPVETFERPSDSPECAARDGESREMRMAQAHHGHRGRRRESTAAGPALKAGSLSLSVSPALLEQLDSLDDAVFSAIAGDPAALAELREMWPAVLRELPPELVEESREHFLTHALRVWEHFVRDGRSPARAVAALDVLTLLCGER